MASNRTLAKRLAERRTWTITSKGSDGKWRQWEYNALERKQKLERERELQRVRIPGKREREALRKVLAEREKPEP